MRVALPTLLALACAPLLAACGGGSGNDVVGVSVRLGAVAGPADVVASARPADYRGAGRVIPLGTVEKELPARLPPNVRQPVGKGTNRFVVVRLAGGRTISYGPLAYPPEITRLASAMWAAVRAGQAVATPLESRREARHILANWHGELRGRARFARLARFHNLPRRVFFARLHRLADRYRFRVVQARILRPAQDAPFVVVEASNPQPFARDLPAIQHQLDPKRRTKDDRTGWAYEGFFLEALDSSGRPFLAIFNFERGPGAGGGQWASRDSLFPYPHG